jgi:hypothetical protein
MKIKIFVILIFLVLTACAAKKRFFPAYIKKPENIVVKVDKKQNKAEYKIYKKRLNLLEKEWELYELVRRTLSDKKYKKFDKYVKKFNKFHKKHYTEIGFDKYADGIEYYIGVKQIRLYEFDNALKIFKNISEKSSFYKLAQEKIKNLYTDTDMDGYIDEWELMEGYNPVNPYSHP